MRKLPRVTVVIAYDGSDGAADAVRAAGRLFPGATAVVLCVRGETVFAFHGAAARIAVPDSVIAAAAEEQELAADARGLAVAERGVKLAASAGLDARAEVRSGASAWRPVAAFAEETDAAVVVCGSRGQGAVSRAVLGSTSTSLLHHAGRPVLVVPDGGLVGDGPALAGYDGSEGARAAIDVVAALLPSREVVVAHAWESPLGIYPALELGPVVREGDLGLALEREVAAMADEVAAEGAELARSAGLASVRGVAVRAEEGIWRTLASAAADADAAVVVAGRRGRGALAAAVLGSVSAGLAHNAERPILVAG